MKLSKAKKCCSFQERRWFEKIFPQKPVGLSQGKIKTLLMRKPEVISLFRFSHF